VTQQATSQGSNIKCQLAGCAGHSANNIYVNMNVETRQNTTLQRSHDTVGANMCKAIHSKYATTSSYCWAMHSQAGHRGHMLTVVDLVDLVLSMIHIYVCYSCTLHFLGMYTNMCMYVCINSYVYRYVSMGCCQSKAGPPSQSIRRINAILHRQY
jgi:hypothetical protein